MKKSACPPGSPAAFFRVGQGVNIAHDHGDGPTAATVGIGLDGLAKNRASGAINGA